MTVTTDANKTGIPSGLTAAAITDAAAASALTGAESFPAVQSSALVEVTGQQLMTLITGSTTLSGATVTTSKPLIDMTQTWNDAAVTFTAAKINVTSTASAAASKLLDLQVASSSLWWVRKDGRQFTQAIDSNGFGGMQIIFQAGTQLQFYNNTTEIARVASDSLRMNAAYFEMTEQTAPAAPSANGVRIYAVDNGAGKTQLMALFSSGAAQQIAIQP